VLGVRTGAEGVERAWKRGAKGDYRQRRKSEGRAKESRGRELRRGSRTGRRRRMGEGGEYVNTQSDTLPE